MAVGVSNRYSSLVLSLSVWIFCSTTHPTAAWLPVTLKNPSANLPKDPYMFRGAGSTTFFPSFATIATTAGSKRLFPKHRSYSYTHSHSRSHPSTLIRTMTSTTSTTTTSASASTTATERDFSLQSLQDRVQNFVTQHSSQCRLVLSIAGGGGHFLSTLAATPGASSVLLEGSINYDRESYRRYVERDLPSELFKYSSAVSAQYAAQASLRRALQLSAAADPAYGHKAVSYMNHSLGMACASALASSNSTAARNSRAYICAHKLEGGLLVEMQVRLTMGLPDAKQRSRFEEDVVVSHCVLDCLEYTLDGGGGGNNNTSSSSSNDTNNDAVHRQEWECTTQYGDTIQTVVTKKAPQSCAQIIQQAVTDIVSGKDSAVLLLPVVNTTNKNARPTFQAVSGRTAGLPPHSLIFPGSFNPPHQGHVELVKESLVAANCQTAWFELSLTNADKPSLDVDTVTARLEHFWSLVDIMPAQWGIILSNAPLFSKKVDLLHPLQVTRSYSGQQQPLTFVIGTDTLVRLLNPKYYDSEADMFRILQQLPAHFCVGGRLAQKKTADGSDDGEPEFVTGQVQVDALPTAELQSKFTVLRDFRVDISSTEIREASIHNGNDGQDDPTIVSA